MVSAILEGKPDKNLILVTGRIHPKLAEDVAEQLGIDVLETTAYDFANGEMYVRYTESVRGADVFVLQSHYKPINKAIMEQLIMIDALKRASARSITAVCPLLGYSRQDKKHRGREPISCRLVFDLLKTAGADRIMSVDLHAAQSQGFFDGPVDHLVAMPVLVDYIRDRFQGHLDNVAVVSPTPAAFAWPSSGRSVSAAVRSLSCTRRATSPARTRRSPTVWSATLPARTACLSMT